MIDNLTNEMDSPTRLGIRCARLKVGNLFNQREGESVMNITTVGIDLAKNVFYLHAVDTH